MKRYLLDTLFVVIIGLYPGRGTLECDMSPAKVEEGNIGQAGTFPWLGVLRVYLQDGDKAEVALSGLVLITKKHALVNADDVARIPDRVFREDTRAMFMVATDTPRFYLLLKYTLHPEYEEKTLNTIAVVELDLDTIEGYITPRPICWTRKKPIATKHFYLTGYTDDNNFLEKVIYRMHYRDKYSCEDFYNKAALDDKTRVPVHYLCVVSPAIRGQCVWENGMALVSNDSAYFALLGLSVRGPGCTAPARFIDLHKYHHWVKEVITPTESEEQRRSNDGDETVNIPAHTLFNMDARRMEIAKPHRMKYHAYPFDPSKLRYFNVDQVDNNSIVVFTFNGTFEAYKKFCDSKDLLLYKENFELKSQYGVFGTAYYKISLYDLHRNLCGCVIVTVHSLWHSPVTLAYKEFFEYGEGLAITSAEETPEMLMREFSIHDWEPKMEKRDDTWSAHKITHPEFIELSRKTTRMLNYDLYIRFGFYGRAKMKVEMFAENKDLTTTTSTISILRRVAGLTPDEERLQFLKQQRVKVTRPPGRKKWYEGGVNTRRIRSGLVENVPLIVQETFGYDDIKHEGSVHDINTESDTSTYLKEPVKSMKTPELKDDMNSIFEDDAKFDDEYQPVRAIDEKTLKSIKNPQLRNSFDTLFENIPKANNEYAPVHKYDKIKATGNEAITVDNSFVIHKPAQSTAKKLYNIVEVIVVVLSIEIMIR